MDAACSHIYFEDKLNNTTRFEVLTSVDEKPCLLGSSPILTSK
jgi:hypothetical protein